MERLVSTGAAEESAAGIQVVAGGILEEAGVEGTLAMGAVVEEMAALVVVVVETTSLVVVEAGEEGLVDLVVGVGMTEALMTGMTI